MAKTTFLLIRHGETDWNLEGRWQGHTDVPLNENGRRQAWLLGKRLQGWHISAIYCSDLQRATETGEIIGRQIGIEPIVDVTWRERDTGEFAGLTGAEIQERHPDIWLGVRQGIAELPGGETSLALQQRVSDAVTALRERHPGEMIAVVTHGGVVRAVIAHVLSLPVDRVMRVRAGKNTGLSIISTHAERSFILERLNDTAHLEFALNGAGAAAEDSYAL